MPLILRLQHPWDGPIEVILNCTAGHVYFGNEFFPHSINKNHIERAVMMVDVLRGETLFSPQANQKFLDGVGGNFLDDFPLEVSYNIFGSVVVKRYRLGLALPLSIQMGYHSSSTNWPKNKEEY